MRMRTVLAAIVLFGPAGAFADPPASKTLEVWPAEVRLSGPASSQRLVVVGVDPDGSRRDLTADAWAESASPGVAAIDARGRVIPKGDGIGTIVVRAGGTEARVPVHVSGAAAARRVSFRHEVVPVLTKLGCNMGTCHGGQHGKGGFKLSLLGFEPSPDFAAIVKSAESRRGHAVSPPRRALLAAQAIARGRARRRQEDGAGVGRV